MVNEAEISRRAWAVIGRLKLDDSITEATVIKTLIVTNITDPEIRDYLDMPQHIAGLLPQCLGGKIEARLSNYCAVRALFELANKPPSVSLAEEWVTTAEECAEVELTDHFTIKARSSKAGSKRRQTDHADIVKHWEQLRNGGASKGSANDRTATRFNITVRQVQKIRKMQKRT